MVVDALLGDSAAAVAEELGGGGADLQAFFDHGVRDYAGAGPCFFEGFWSFLVGK